ncbi:MAG: hypothetical protein KIT84_34700 [Labilithrix sp.]|nr:hypothetical protein [Labilithrix sp.]MCW5816199.1 hypothetical protein [Labilithrix sp.]
MRRLLSLAAAAAFLTVPAVASAQEQGDSTAMRANRGLRFGFGPQILLPSDGGPLGGGLVLEGRYGFKAGPTVLAPGGRLGGYLLSERFIGTAMPTFRITLPLGPLAPYVVGGVGGGWLSNRAESGVAWLGGGGLMIHFGRILAIGAEATYEAVTGTEFKVLGIGPAIHIGG